MTTRTKIKKSQGFTLIEMLLVVSLLALLIALILPGLTKARETSRRAVCANNLRQMVNACVAYAGDYINWTPNAPRFGAITNGSSSGTRNIWYGAEAEVVGKAMWLGYLPVKSSNVYCPSRDPKARYAPNAWAWGWAGWGLASAAVEYSYMHRLQSRLNRVSSSKVFGSDVAIVDTYWVGSTMIGNTSVGAPVTHQDQYYNVSYYDLSVRSFIDKTSHLELPIYFNAPAQALNKIEQLD